MGGKKTPVNRPLGSFLAPLAPPHGALRLCPPKERRGHGSPVVALAANARCKLQHKAQALLKIEPLVAYPKLEAAPELRIKQSYSLCSGTSRPLAAQRCQGELLRLGCSSLHRKP
jgi:hypothetical protein